MTRILLVLCLLSLPGCRLNDLLNPGPPPKEEVCERTWKIRLSQNNGADTTYITRRQIVQCETDDPNDGR